MLLAFNHPPTIRAWHRAWKRYAGAHDRHRTPPPDVPVLARMPRSLRHIKAKSLFSDEELGQIDDFLGKFNVRRAARVVKDTPPEPAHTFDQKGGG